MPVDVSTPVYLAGTNSQVLIFAGPVADPSAIVTAGAALTPPATTWDVEDGTSDREMGADETTNLASGGYFEDVPTVKKWTLSNLNVVQRSGGMLVEIHEGDIVAVALITPNGRTIQGNMRVHKISEKSINPKAKASMTIDLVSYRKYVVTLTGS